MPPNTPQEPPAPAPATVTIGARVPPETRDAIDGLRELYPGATETATTRSDLLRAFVDAALPVVGDLDAHRRLQRLARSRGVSVGEVLRLAVQRGLAAMEAGR